MREGIRRLLADLWPAVYFLCPFILAIPVIQPFLSDQLTTGYDNVLHLWRAVETGALLDAGILYSRWQPHMASGFGYPSLLFSPPLSPLLASLFHRLGLEWVAAVNGVFVVGTVLSGWTMWLLVRDCWEDGAGVIAATIVLTLPFHAYVIFHRASMSEALAWAFPGLILWGLLRWQRCGQRRGLVAAAGGQAAMLLTHDVSTYLFLPLSLVAIAALALAHRRPRMFGRGVVALALGVGLAAFSWLPSVLERSHVQFDRALEYPYAASFVSLDHLLEPPRAVDPSLTNPWLPKGIGLLPALVAFPALVACFKAHTREQRFWLGAILACTVGYLWLASPFARPVWRLIPWLSYLQFPWRFLTPAAFGVAILGGAGIGWLQRRSFFAAPLAMAALILGSLGWLYPPHSPLPQPATLPGMLAYERTVGWIGGTTFGELFPAWVHRLPREHALDGDLNAGREPVRLRPEDLPDGARVLNSDYAPLEAMILLETPISFRVRYLAFYYPGWRVWVDGEPVEVTPTDPEGLIGFDVPAGRHVITVRFTETPLRLIADGISLLSLFFFAVLIVRRSQPLVTSSPCRLANQSSDSPAPSSPKRLRSQFVLLASALLIVLLKVAIIDRFENPLRRSNLEGDHLRRVDVPTQVSFDDQFRLLGYDALPEEVPGDQSFEVRLYWQDTVPGGPDYRVGLALRDGRGLTWNDPDLRSPRWHRVPPPAYLWPPDGYAATAFELHPLTGIPPGVYTVTLGVFDRATLAPYAAGDAAGQALGLEVPLGWVRVTRPRRPLTPETLTSQYEANVPFGPLRLVGYDLDRAEAAPGDPFLLTLFWQADEAPEEDIALRLRLLECRAGCHPASQEVVAFDLPLVRDDFPTNQWQAGDLWRGQHLFRLPAGLESGEHRWMLQLCRGAGAMCSEVALATIQVHAPERLWEAPSLDVETDARLGDVVTLLGATLQPETYNLNPGTTLTVTLAWRAEMEMDVSYRVFLHLVGPDGGVVAQSDGEPAGWTRPTTGWLPGEVVLDEHVLALPEGTAPGEYRLQAGMYILDEGRLTTSEGTNTVALTIIRVDEER